MSRITATEASRSFSDLLNRVASGERFEVMRNGMPVAQIAPAAGSAIRVDELRQLLLDVPAPDPGWHQEWDAARRDLSLPGDPWATSSTPES